MPSMELVKGECACCGEKQIFEIYSNSEMIVDKKLTLSKLFEYVAVNVNTCQNCGYSNDNLAELIGENVKEVVESNEYKKVLDDGFINDYKDLPTDAYKRFKGGAFEAMAMLYEKNNLLNFKYTKILKSIYNIKSSIRGYYFEDRCDLEDSKLEEKYDKVISFLTSELKILTEKCANTLIKYELTNPYEIIFVAEWFAKAEQYDFARQLIQKVKDEYEFNSELNDYVEEFLSEIETL